MILLLSVITMGLIVPNQALFFGAAGGGGGGGGGCACAAPPACAPVAQPVACPQYSAPACIPQPCSGGGNSYSGASNYYPQQNSYQNYGSQQGGGSYVQAPSNYGPQGGSSYASAPQQFGSPSYASAPQQPQQFLPQLAQAPVLAASYASQPNQVPPPPPPPHVQAPPPPSPLYVQAPPPPPPPHAKEVVAPPPPSYAKGGQAAGQKLQEVDEDSDNNSSENIVTSTPELNLESTESRENKTVTTITSPNSEVNDPIDISELKLTNSTECNSEELRNIILANIEDDLNTSKRLIQLASENKFGGRFDVICSGNDFSFVTNTELFCQEMKRQVSCYAYRQL